MPIQILPALLANQIAAGEVVERPASVVKELVENSLDSGASSIEIDIEKGGHKRILIRDNGSGIVHEELALALSRHATSKIAKLDDLEAICSLGFRGEALASISSVARLTLSSKPKQQTQGWQAQSEGRDMHVQLNPVAHPNGTSVDVVDLFFNTPARRKFLRTEKTEFAHIDEVVRRIALSRFDVSFSLKHNGKLLRKYPAVKSQSNETKRLSAICGKEFSEQVIELNSQYQQFELKGWLAKPEMAKGQADFQYFYVNGRMMRDKLINHAVRHAFEGLIAADLSPSYVLYLTLEANQVDINVHPAKHEVRFHQARLVHDFIYRALTDGFNQYFEQNRQYEQEEQLSPDVTVLPRAEPKHDYIQPLHNVIPGTNEAPRNNTELKANATSEARVTEEQSSYTNKEVESPKQSNGLVNKEKSQHMVNSSKVITQSAKNYQQLMTPKEIIHSHSSTASSSTSIPQANTLSGQWLRVNNEQLLINIEQHFYLLDTAVLHLNFLSKLYAKAIPVCQPLLMPVSIKATAELLEQAKLLYQPLLENSVEIGWTPNRIILRKVPAGLRQFRWVECLNEILLCNKIELLEVREHLLTCVVSNEEMSHIQIQELWLQFVSTSENLAHDLTQIAKPIPLKEWVKSL